MIAEIPQGTLPHCGIASCFRHTKIFYGPADVGGACSSEAGTGWREDHALIGDERKFERKTGFHFC